jgi:hypothetical protein|tara:strand:+ start:723 stop:902 length:180 start_codon:yes stop_codon:yes gene_type:complete
MRVLLQFITETYTIELGVYWGILFGFRTFEPDINYNQYELQVYIPFIYLAIVKKLDGND